MAGSGERYNASLLLDANVEAGRGEKTAIFWGQERVSYGELLAGACRAGAALRELGVGREDRVLVVMDDHPNLPAIFLGAIRAGAVPVPLNPMYSPGEYPHFVQDSGARILIADPARAPVVLAGLGDLAARVRLFVTGGEADGFADFDEVQAAQPGEMPPADTGRDDMCFWLYSSGSTGKPKGVVHLQGHMAATCETYARHVVQIRESDVTFSSTKLFHAYGLGNNLSFPYWAGAATVLLSGRPTPDALFDTLERFRPTLFFSVPTLFNAMLNVPGAESRALSSVRLCISAAEALPAEVWHRWHAAFGLSILDGIGSTEMLHIYCSNTAGDVVPGSSGRPVPGYEVRILDEEGTEVPPSEGGNMWVRGESALAGYWNQPEKTAACLRDGWFFTGDRYRRDADGSYWYEGRADDMFKVHGLWVSPVEVEAALMEHPGVVEAAVVGVQVQGFTQARAYVIPREVRTAGEALREDLATFCKGRLRGYQRPSSIEFVPDLPRTVTGKIQRFKLRAAAAAKPSQSEQAPLAPA